MEGTIEGGSSDSIVVAPKYGSRQEVARSDIAEIDHPGNVHVLVGGLVLAYGIVNIAVGMEECQNRNEQQAAFCVGVFTPAAIGAGMVVWGLATWMGSTSAADDRSLPPMAQKPAPAPVSAALPPKDATPVAAPPVTTAPAPPPHAEPLPPAPTSPPSAAPAPPEDEPMVPVPPK